MTKETEQLLKWDKEHLMHPGWRIGEDTLGVVIEEAHGVTLRDTEGKEYLDTSSQLVSVNLGHGQKRIIDAACEQMRKLQYGTLFLGWSNRPAIECAHKLAEITPGDLNHVTFVDSGSEAVDSAIRLARLYWLNQGKNKYKILSLGHAYHGATQLASSLTNIGSDLWLGTASYTSGVVHVPTFYCYRCPFGLEYPSCGIRCAQYVDEVIKLEEESTVAAFLGETVHGAGGCIAPPPEYWPIVREICTKHNILLINDEVMAGFARTGKLFAVENYGHIPDIMTVAKGLSGCYLPMGAAIVNDKVFEGLKGTFMFGYTYSGNPICAVAAMAAMDMYIKEKVADNAAKVGQHLNQRLEAEFKPLPNVGTLKGIGLFRAIEIVADKATKATFDASLNVEIKVRQRAMENGLFLRAGGSNIFINPPCTVTTEEVDRMLDILYPIVRDIKVIAEAK